MIFHLAFIEMNGGSGRSSESSPDNPWSFESWEFSRPSVASTRGSSAGNNSRNRHVRYLLHSWKLIELLTLLYDYILFYGF